jgi:AcrR family transcriptional regulator
MQKVCRKDQKDLTRKKLIDTAIHIFARQGITATTTADVAKAAGVSHGTVFLHFPCRDDLVFAAIRRFGKHLCAAFEAHTQNNIKDLRGVLKAHLQVLFEFEDFYSRLVKEAHLLSPKIKSYFFILQASVSHRMFVNAEYGMQQGKVRRIKRDLLFNTWIALVHYYLTHRDIFSPEKSVIQEKSKELIDHFMSLVKT